jgi:formylglycine-generating enzyme required for sulfatase activity
VLGRGERKPVRLDLPGQASVPEGFVYVPEGDVLYGSTADEDIRSAFFKAAPMHRREVGAFLIAQRETTFAQWIDFLEDVPADERQRRMPRPGTWGKVALTRSAPASYELTMTATNAMLRARSGEPLAYERRDRRQRVDWMKLPVSGISTDDAVAYTRWLSATGRVPGARLCTELEWERAARGADDRTYPHGYALMADDANFLSTYGAGAGPDEVGAHPASRSPFGVDDLTGNVFEFTTHATRAGAFVARGGGFFFDSVVNQISNRTEVETDMLGLFAGLRVCASPPR